jgi:hypothetical protein
MNKDMDKAFNAGLGVGIALGAVLMLAVVVATLWITG